MKVKVLIEVNIDPEKWAYEFLGGEATTKEVEADVKQYVKVLVNENPVIGGLQGTMREMEG